MNPANLLWPEEKTGELRSQLQEYFSVQLNALCSRMLLAGAMLSIAFLFAAFLLEMQPAESIALFLAFLLSPLLLSLLFYSYMIERRKKELEKEAPMLLLQASVFPKGTPVSTIISYLSRKENGLLGKEFAKAEREIGKGATMEKALASFKHRNKGRVLERMSDMLLIAYESGAYLGNSFRELAEELLEVQSMMAEKKAVLSIERATLLLGSAFVVPFILGILTGMVFCFDFSGMEIEGFSSSIQRAELLAVASTATHLYIIEYALIASLFLGWLEGKPRKAFVYALALLPLSTIVFLSSQGFGLV